jgi:hypothetical protein
MKKVKDFVNNGKVQGIFWTLAGVGSRAFLLYHFGVIG